MTVELAALTVTEPEILDAASTDSTAHLTLRVPRQLRYFDGHFPKFSILPGAVQLHWVVGFAHRYFGVGGTASAIRVKFVQPVRPGAILTLTLRRGPDRRISFESQADGTPCASGQITFSSDVI